MKHSVFVVTAGIFCCAASPAMAKPGPRLLIMTDVEGVGGVQNYEEQLVPGQRRFDESRRLLIAELNAAVQGAFAAGASEIIVWDGHDGSRTLSVEDIPPRTKLIQGGRPIPEMHMAPKAYDGILFIGQHAMSGSKNGVLAHTQGFNVQAITLNGKPVGELGQLAAIAGDFDIPVIMLSGDQGACEELLDIQPGAETVAVKVPTGLTGAISLSHADVKRLIRDKARRAVARIKEFKPWKVQGPVEMKIMEWPKEDGMRQIVPGETPKTPLNTRTYSGQNVVETYQHWLNRKR